MGGALFYSHSVLHLPSFSTSDRPKLGKPVLALKETAHRQFLSSIRADGNRERQQHIPKSDGPEDNPQSFDGGSSLSPNKKEILAVFKRIQASISTKGEKMVSTKKSTKAAEDKLLEESMKEVLHQSRVQGKGKIFQSLTGKISGRIKGDVSISPKREDASKKEEREQQPSTIGSTSTRPPSNFTRRSPIRTFSTPTDKVQLKNGTLPETPKLSVSRNEVEPKNEIIAAIHDDSDQESNKYEDMKLSELKDLAKSKGIKGYSKLKKSELVELIIRSLN